MGRIEPSQHVCGQTPSSTQCDRDHLTLRWWALIHCDWCPGKRRLRHWQSYAHMHTHVTLWRHMEKMACLLCKPRRKASKETNPADTLIVDFQLSDLILLKSPSQISVCWVYNSNCLDPGPSYGTLEGRIGGHYFSLFTE